MKFTKALDMTVLGSAVVGTYVLIWVALLMIFNPNPLGWPFIYWILFIVGLVGGTGLYVRLWTIGGFLTKRYIKIEEIKT